MDIGADEALSPAGPFREPACSVLPFAGESTAVCRCVSEPDFRANLALMPPYEGWVCPLCGAELVRLASTAYCSACKAEHRPLKPVGE